VQVELVRDPAGDDVAEQARERGLLPRHVVVGDPVADRRRRVLVNSAVPQRFEPDRTLQPAGHRGEQLQRRGTEDDADPVPVQLREPAAGRVLQDPVRDEEAQQLCGVGRGELVRRDPVRHRVERHRVEEGAPAAVRLVGRLRVRVVVVVDEPVRRGYVGDEVPAGHDGAPEPFHVGRSGKQGAQAHDGDRNVGTGHRRHLSSGCAA
jgi:hypothetical protein